MKTRSYFAYFTFVQNHLLIVLIVTNNTILVHAMQAKMIDFSAKIGGAPRQPKRCNGAL